MGGKPLDDVSDDDWSMPDVRRRDVRRDIVMNGVVSVLVGALAYVIVPPLNRSWPADVQLLITAAVGLATFFVAFAVFVVPEVLWGILRE